MWFSFTETKFRNGNHWFGWSKPEPNSSMRYCNWLAEACLNGFLGYKSTFVTCKQVNVANVWFKDTKLSLVNLLYTKISICLFHGLQSRNSNLKFHFLFGHEWLSNWNFQFFSTFQKVFADAYNLKCLSLKAWEPRCFMCIVHKIRAAIKCIQPEGVRSLN